MATEQIGGDEAIWMKKNGDDVVAASVEPRSMFRKAGLPRCPQQGQLQQFAEAMPNRVLVEDHIGSLPPRCQRTERGPLDRRNMLEGDD